ncbi:hypothetical protein Tco_1190602 [Tanacetum coccineum]
MVACLEKIEGNRDFYQIIDFLNLRTESVGAQNISATIDGKHILVSEASIRRHLKLEDSEGVTSLPNS